MIKISINFIFMKCFYKSKNRLYINILGDLCLNLLLNCKKFKKQTSITNDHGNIAYFKIE